jgi:hypothetical protein
VFPGLPSTPPRPRCAAFVHTCAPPRNAPGTVTCPAFYGLLGTATCPASTILERHVSCFHTSWNVVLFERACSFQSALMVTDDASFLRTQETSRQNRVKGRYFENNLYKVVATMQLLTTSRWAVPCEAELVSTAAHLSRLLSESLMFLLSLRPCLAAVTP